MRLKTTDQRRRGKRSWCKKMSSVCYLATSGLFLFKLIDLPEQDGLISPRALMDDHDHDHTYATKSDAVSTTTEQEDVKPNVDELNRNLAVQAEPCPVSERPPAVPRVKRVTRSCSKLLRGDDLTRIICEKTQDTDAPRIRLKRVDGLKRICSSVNLSLIDVYTADKVSLSFKTTKNSVRQAVAKEKEKSLASGVLEVFKVKFMDGPQVREYITERSMPPPQPSDRKPEFPRF